MSNVLMAILVVAIVIMMIPLFLILRGPKQIETHYRWSSDWEKPPIETRRQVPTPIGLKLAFFSIAILGLYALFLALGG